MPGTRKNWARRLTLWGFAGLIVLMLGVWLLRKPAASALLSGWCAERNLVCEASFDRLDLAGVTLSDVAVQAGTAQPVSADKIDVKLSWSGLNPVVSSVSVQSPRVQARLREGAVDLYGLEQMFPSGGGGGSISLPAIDITDGQAILETESGTATARFSLTGQFFDHADLDILMDPVALESPDSRLLVDQGRVTLSAREGRLIGDVAVSVSDIFLEGVSIRDTHLDGLIDTPVETGTATRVRLSGKVGTALIGTAQVEAAELDLNAEMESLPEAGLAAILDSLTELAIDLRGSSAGMAAYSAGPFSMEAHLLRGEEGLSGPVRLGLTQGASPFGAVETVDMEGSLSDAGHDTGTLDGKLAASGLAVSPILRTLMTRAVDLPAPLDAHGEALGAAISKAGSHFGLETGFRASIEDTGMAISFKDPAVLAARSGLSVSITPEAGSPWLEAGASGLGLNGLLKMHGGGGPTASAQLAAQRGTDEMYALQVQHGVISPWTVQGRTFGANIRKADLSGSPGEMQAGFNGHISAQGDVLGLQLSQTKLTGAANISRSEGKWSGSLQGKTCPAFETEGVVFGAIRSGAFALDICPPENQFFSPSGAASGGLELGQVSVPFVSGSVSGYLGLSGARLTWSADGGSAIRLGAEQMELPLEIGEATLTISGAEPDLAFASARGRTPALSAQLGQTDFSGTLIPAKLSAEAFSFDGTSPAGGVTGKIQARNVLIQDILSDPVYMPLLAGFDGQLTEGMIIGEGDLRLQATGQQIGKSLLSLRLSDLTGALTVQTNDLVFSPSGLRPTQISERLRGLFTGATGKLSAQAQIGINGGKLSGTGDVDLSDFSFQTTRLGYVENVNAKVHFTDLFNITTAPGQTLTVDALDPGVRLTNGRMVFQFEDKSVFRVAAASFPFAGGELALAPFDWTLGGQDQHLEVTAGQIGLRDLVETLNLPDIEASGTVSGRFPIDVIGSQVFIRNATLMADASGGHLAYAGGMGDAAAAANSTTAMAFEALKDFDFTVLQLSLDGNIADSMTVGVLLSGKSRKGIPFGTGGQTVKGQPFEFDIEITSPLSELVGSSQYYTGQKALTDIVVEQVQARRAGESE